MTMIQRAVIRCFNPRARGGRDLKPPKYFDRLLEFQSTRPRGARLAVAEGQGGQYGVSIHAPAGGATPSCQFLLMLIHCFNPRARGGRDSKIWVYVTDGGVSIHAPAGGATQVFPHR